MTLQKQLAERIYEVFPHKVKKYTEHDFHWEGEYDFGFSPCLHCGVEQESNKDTLCTGVATDTLRLTDLVLAIEESMKFNASWEPYRTAITTLLMPRYNVGVYQNASLYNLSHDNIMEQSDELCTFALSLLGSKK